MKTDAARTTPPSEDEIKSWLVEHYSHARKLSTDRIAALVAARDAFPYLRPPADRAIYRGLFNVSAAALEGLRKGASTDATRDKSWTTDRTVAEAFAHGRFANVSPIKGRYSVVLEARMPRGAVLDANACATLEGVGGHWNPIWGEPLAAAIRDEQEVVVGESVRIVASTAQRNEGDALTKLPRVDFAGVIRLVKDGEPDIAPVPGTMPARLDPRTGYLRVDAVLARSGLLMYSDGVSSWTEYRSANELRKWAPSFASTPYTAGHPAAMVDSKSWTSVARGVVLEQLAVRDDAATGLSYLDGTILICDAERVAGVMRGEAVEVSIGFLSNVVPHADGVAPDGTKCNASQMDGEGNHVAGVERGRAGPQCRLVLDGAVVPFANPFAPDLTQGLVPMPDPTPAPKPKTDIAEVTETEVMNPETGKPEKVQSWIAARLATLEAQVQAMGKPVPPPAPAQPQPMAEAAGMPMAPPMPAPPADDKDKEKAKDAAALLVRAGRLGLDATAVLAMDATALMTAVEDKSRAVIAAKAPHFAELAKRSTGDALAALVDAAELAAGTPASAGGWTPPAPTPIKPTPRTDSAPDPDERIARAIGLAS